MIGLQRRLIDKINELNWSIETKLIEKDQSIDPNERLMNAIYPDGIPNQSKGESMVTITIEMVIQLIGDLNLNPAIDQAEAMNFERLLPFGCKLVKRSFESWAIGHYAYDQSDYKKLQDRFNYLPEI